MHRLQGTAQPEQCRQLWPLRAVLRTYVKPEESDRVSTINLPHVMYYAPDVSSEDIGGGKPGGTYPAVILHGHHGYTMQPLGVTETAVLERKCPLPLDSNV